METKQEYWEKQAEWFEKKAIERSQTVSWKAFQQACQMLEEKDREMAEEVGNSYWKSAYDFQKEILASVQSNQKKSIH